MLAKERGTCAGSDLYFQTPSEHARRLLYYMTSCGAYYTDYDYRIEREDYGNFLLFYICAGRLSVRSGETTLVAGPGQVGFLNCHLPHEYHTIGATEFVWLHMDGVNTAQIHEYVCQRYGGFVFDIPCAETIKEQIYEMVYACRNHQLPQEVRLSEMLYRLLVSYLDGEDTAKKPGVKSCDAAPMEAAIRFIEDNYHTDISLEDAAQHVNMSKYHFARLFKKNCGYSPHEFLILTRLNRAKYLLKTTDLPVKIIAQDVGYQNAATFTNAFTSRVGLSPSQFREFPI